MDVFQGMEPEQQPAGMTDEDLVRILKDEASEATSYHDSELAKNQEDALNRYFARPYGNEEADTSRSSVVTHDLEDTINWMMPDLMRCFTSADDLVSVEASSPEDDQPIPLMRNGQMVMIPGKPGPDGLPTQPRPKMSSKSKVDLMGAYLSHVYFKDNRATENTHDFCFDGLLSRLGIMKVSWEDPKPKPPQIIEGVSQETLLQYANDPEYEILGYADEEGPEGPVFMLEVRRTPKMGRVYIEAVPPEEFAINKLAKNIQSATYHRRRQTAYLSELCSEYPDKEYELRERRGSAEELTLSDDGRRQARYPNDNVNDAVSANDTGRKQVILHEEYIRVDFDGDGIVELRQVKRVDNIILENIAVSYSDYVAWTPSRVSHRVVGRSIYDMLADIQKIRTQITRSYLDGLSSTLSPRTYVNTNLMDEDGLDAVLENKISSVIPVKGDPNAAVKESEMPDISGPALNALEYFDQRGQESSGVTKHSQGMDPQALNKTATGIDLLQAAAKTRIEMVAVWLGVGLEDVFKRILQLVVAHQDKPRQVKLFGEWTEIDPRRWSDEMSITINTGSAGVSKQQRIANLMMIAEKQEQVLMQAGPSNPLVTLQHYRNTLAAICAAQGFKDPGLFFGDVPEDMPAPEPQPDPKMIEVQGKLQLDQFKSQFDAQMTQQKQAGDQQLAAQKIDSERELALIKAQSEREIAEIRIAAETQIARERMTMEAMLAREKASIDADLAERDSKRRAEVGAIAARSKVNGANGKLPVNRPGGDLSQ